MKNDNIKKIILQLYNTIKYIYIVSFSPVKQESGIIPSGQKDHSTSLVKEPNVTDIAEQ